eukprot:TRINITY_DN24131_c0_g1_i1.p1 TRINITY_DN24131_c0_g1~~TRINITY_DN24131_c0_g1_i1.p1  ORF type:complete len:334 (+),score=58.39 TRINITY_DN24131_c0_g1_i1:46-1047(+)
MMEMERSCRAIRAPRSSLMNDLSSAELRTPRTGRRSVSPAPAREADLMTSKKRTGSIGAYSPPPYGVGSGSPSLRKTGRKATPMTAQINKMPLRLTDQPVGSIERMERGASPLKGLRQIMPRNCIPHLSEPPADFRVKVQCRSRSCPPGPSQEIQHKQKSASPMKTVSNISVSGGVLAGENTGRRQGRGGVQLGVNSQHFTVSRQHHAPAVTRNMTRSSSCEPMSREDLPLYVAKKRLYAPHGEGTAAAMCWNKPVQYQFARKKLHHQQSDNVHSALAGRSLAEPVRGRRGVTGHSLTFCSHSVTNAESLPTSQHNLTRAHRPNSTFSHTRLW